MSSFYPGGPHELGQNFLIDRKVIDSVCRSVAETNGTIVEFAPGDGAVTLPLSRLGRPVTAVEIDPSRTERLDGRTPEHVTVVNDDLLSYRLPRLPHVVVSNVPFHLTTPLLRRLLAASHWHTAILLVQWEVARRRAGVGGASMMTASWWPWYEFDLHSRIPARAFRPVPAVDGGLITITRREQPMITARKPYQRFVREIFTGRGRGIRDIVVRTGHVGRGQLDRWLREHEVAPRALPKELTATQWAALWRLTTAR